MMNHYKFITLFNRTTQTNNDLPNRIYAIHKEISIHQMNTIYNNHKMEVFIFYVVKIETIALAMIFKIRINVNCTTDHSNHKIHINNNKQIQLIILPITITILIIKCFQIIYFQFQA